MPLALWGGGVAGAPLRGIPPHPSLNRFVRRSLIDANSRPTAWTSDKRLVRAVCFRGHQGFVRLGDLWTVSTGLTVR